MSQPAGRVAVIVPAAGFGQRLGGGTPKALRLLQGRSLLDWAVTAMAAHPAVVQVVLAVPPQAVAQVSESLPDVAAEVRVVSGANSRQASVAVALAAADASCDIVLVHDAARPLVPLALVERVIDALTEGAAAVVPGLPVVDTIKRIDAAGFVVETPARRLLRAVQTPQGFRREVLIAAHRQAPDTESATDDAVLAEQAGFPVLVVPGDPAAMKITTTDDFDRAERLLAAMEHR